MKELILLRGLPGAGKSTLAKRVCNQHIEADMLLHEIVFYRENKRTKKGYWYVIDKWNKEFTKREIIGTTVYFETYEEAESACFDKLIELVGKAK